MTSLTLMLAAAVAFHHGPRSECLDCGEDDAVVQAKIEKLQTACLWPARRQAARQLGRFDWEQHPEIVDALVGALASDRQGLVRQEAAASLGKMKPCLPVAHEALACAAANDRGPLVRHAAKRALKALDKTCVEPCDVCGPGAMDFEEVLPPLESEPGETIIAPPPGTLLEPLEPTSLRAPIVPTSPSPFATVESSAAAMPPRRASRPTIRLQDETMLVAPATPIDLVAPESGRPR